MRVRAWSPIPEHFSQIEGLPGMLKLTDSDSVKAWSLMKSAVWCRPPGNLVVIHWYECRKFAAKTVYGHGPFSLVCAQQVCECVWECLCEERRVLPRW